MTRHERDTYYWAVERRYQSMMDRRRAEIRRDLWTAALGFCLIGFLWWVAIEGATYWQLTHACWGLGGDSGI